VRDSGGHAVVLNLNKAKEKKRMNTKKKKNQWKDKAEMRME
jgi:hypothetical protein